MMKEYTFDVKTHLIGVTTITVKAIDFHRAKREAIQEIGQIDMADEKWKLWHYDHRTEAEVSLEPVEIKELEDEEDGD